MGSRVRARVGWAQRSASFAWTPPERRNDIRQLASHELKLLEHGLSVGPQMPRAGHYPIPEVLSGPTADDNAGSKRPHGIGPWGLGAARAGFGIGPASGAARLK
jgi:hypothetical protein